MRFREVIKIGGNRQKRHKDTAEASFLRRQRIYTDQKKAAQSLRGQVRCCPAACRIFLYDAPSLCLFPDFGFYNLPRKFTFLLLMKLRITDAGSFYNNPARGSTPGRKLFCKHFMNSYYQFAEIGLRIAAAADPGRSQLISVSRITSHTVGCGKTVRRIRSTGTCRSIISARE